MRQIVAALAATVVWNTAASDCIATGYRDGELIPLYSVLGTRSLMAEWEKYEKEAGRAAWLRYDTRKKSEQQPLERQCLVDVAIVDSAAQPDQPMRESVIVQKPCDEIVIGRPVRLTLHRHCTDIIGGPQDFYATLPYRHARIVRKVRH